MQQRSGMCVLSAQMDWDQMAVSILFPTRPSRCDCLLRQHALSTHLEILQITPKGAIRPP
jgi:hypothetical protein